MHYRFAGTVGMVGGLLLAPHPLSGCSSDRFSSCKTTRTCENVEVGGSAGAMSSSDSGGASANGAAGTSAGADGSSGGASSSGTTSAADSTTDQGLAGAGGVPASGDAALGEACDVGDDCRSSICTDGLCTQCAPATTDCVGATPRLCSGDGSWVNQAACNGATPVCAGGTCVACAEGETRTCADCNDDGTQTCSNGAWGPCEYGRFSCDNTPTCNGESCCRSILVEGGAFFRGETTDNPATVSSFCLDKYEVTVGRFREFIAAYDDWTPAADAGEHLPGAGTGWLSDWNKGDELPADAASFSEALGCHEDYATWQNEPGTDSQENLPQTCLNWYESFAFCIWDGGRLATEAEWEYAASGGAEERAFPWGSQAPNASRALFDCTGDGSAARECSFSDLRPVGSRQPDGNGRWGHSDLAGSVWEWLFDYADAPSVYVSPCNDCAKTELTDAGYRLDRSGAWNTPYESLNPTLRSALPPDDRRYSHGARCVRNLP